MSGGSKASLHSPRARSRASSRSSRPRSSARVNGPGRMPAPIIIPTSMSLAEATPSSSTRHDSTRVFRPIRSTIVPAALALAVLIEAPPRLLAEVARLDQLLHLARHEEAVAVGLAQVLGDVQDRVEPEQVGQEERPHRHRARLLDELVDLLDLQALLLGHAPDLRHGGVEDAVHDEAGHLAAADRGLADLLREVGGRLDRLLRALLALDHL